MLATIIKRDLFYFRGGKLALSFSVSYEVFARKYRPQTFDDLVGQTHVSRTLKNAVEQNRLAHAYLFVGPRGVGKTSTARILAKALNCIHGPTVKPCGVCDNCREIAAGNSLDVIEIDGASNNSVDDVRELRDNVRYAPAKARYKIYLIDEVHMLSAQAFNALLKTLEEPPPHVKFIFATTEPQKVLPTILSRCQRFDLHRIPANLIAQHLQFIAHNEKFSLEPAAAHAIARGAEGGLRDAESMLDQLVSFCGDPISEADVLKVFGFTSEQTVADFTDKILRGATAEAIELLHDQCENGKDMMKLMSDLIAYLRDLLVFKVKPEALADDSNPELQTALATQAGMIETDRLLDLIDQFAAAEGRMGKEVPKRKIVAGVADAGYKKSLAPRDARATQGESALDPTRIWEQLRAKIPSQKAFLRNSAGAAHVLGTDGRNFVLGFSPEQKSMMEILTTPANRKFVEGLLQEIGGNDWTLKATVNDELAPKDPKAHEMLAADPNSYQDVPLIREALEIFKGEIKT